MSSKNNNIWLWVIIGIVVVLVISNSNILQKKQTASITTNYYDANGNKINFQPYDFNEATKINKNTFSIFGLFSTINQDSCINCSNNIEKLTSPISSLKEGGDGAGAITYGDTDISIKNETTGKIIRVNQ